MAYLMNAWYVAAWLDEVGDAALGRTILDEALVLFRGADGAVVAANNMCPHRFAPLDQGKVIDGTIECPYHGLRFDAGGRCVFNPDGEGRIPVRARLKTYPIVERWGCAWIWMGTPELADPSMIPEYAFLTSPKTHRPVKGLLHVRANYRLINDNLMDAAHVALVHATSLHCDMVARTPTQLVEQPDGTIWANRLGQNGAPPPIFEMMWAQARGERTQDMDHWAEAGWNAPSLVRNNTGIAVHGQPRETGLETKNTHFLTPETQSTTHYFWSICRDFNLDDTALDDAIFAGSSKAFVEEDEVMLHAIQHAVGDRDFWSRSPAFLQADIGLVKLRRALDKMIAAEQAGAQQAVPVQERQFQDAD